MELECSPANGRDLIFPNLRAEQVYKAFLKGGVPRWLCLEGGFGSGKTEAAPVMLRERTPDLDRGDMVTLNAATKEGGVDGMRSAFQALRYVGLNSAGVRCLIINEVDRFSGVAAKELKGKLDGIVPGKIPIIVTTNEPHNLDGAVVSHFAMVHWGMPPEDKLMARAQTVLAADGYSMPAEKLLKLIRLARNEPRKLFTEVLPLAL